ncbi:hypothetical protein [Rufibacter roseus]|uniref:Uncharacterized protein n=1 Tax=Rufibacter roseus TaxID=1567108 RepID=A0ABW2DKH1_9BACT|nr:hypothetical protein [Rufibacter roseus]
MKFRFKFPELVVLLLIFSTVGFTAGYLFTIGFSIIEYELITEKMILFASFGILIPLLFGLLIISKGAYSVSSSDASKKTTRRRRMHNA